MKHSESCRLVWDNSGAENNIVTFDLERGLKGMNAVNVALEVEKAKEKKENKETLNTES